MRETYRLLSSRRYNTTQKVIEGHTAGDDIAPDASGTLSVKITYVTIDSQKGQVCAAGTSVKITLVIESQVGRLPASPSP